MKKKKRTRKVPRRSSEIDWHKVLTLSASGDYIARQLQEALYKEVEIKKRK